MRAMAMWLVGGALGGLASAVTAAAGAALSDPGYSQVQLLQGEFTDGTWSAGVQIDLAEGWKTYWRMPGESGIAPLFDWSGSDNVAGVELRWPAPERYQDASGETIGYARRVVFPVTVQPKDASQPVELNLELSYAVCNDICVPAHVELGRTLVKAPAKPSAAAALIRQFEARVPQARSEGVELERASLEVGAGAPLLAVALTGEAVDEATEIFVENFDDAYFRAPRLVGRKGGEALFHLPIDDLADPAALRGRKLRLTVVTATAWLAGEVTVE